MSATELAIKDMQSCGISCQYLRQEKDILEYLNYSKSGSYDNTSHPDFRAFNKKSIKELY